MAEKTPIRMTQKRLLTCLECKTLFWRAAVRFYVFRGFRSEAKTRSKLEMQMLKELDFLSTNGAVCDHCAKSKLDKYRMKNDH